MLTKQSFMQHVRRNNKAVVQAADFDLNFNLKMKALLKSLKFNHHISYSFANIRLIMSIKIVYRASKLMVVCVVRKSSLNLRYF